MTTIGWTHLFLDRPRGRVDAAAAFWATVTGSTLSSWRGEHTFVTLEPPDGDSYLRVQAVEVGSGVHLDVEVDDLEAASRHASDLGAEVDVRHAALVVLRSPAGLALCLKPRTRAAARPAPFGHPGLRVDQATLDLPPDRYDEEAAFWTALTGWERLTGRLPEFEVLRPPPGQPVRILLQRLGSGTVAGSHVDLATADRPTTQQHHVTLGADVVAVHEHWTVMTDPAGGRYCLTDRDPQTGALVRG